MKARFLSIAFALVPSLCYADAIGFSWDSSGPCSAQSIVSGVPCNLNAAAQATARAAGNDIDVIDLEDRNITLGRQPIVEGWYDFTLLAELTAYFNVNELGWFSENTSTQGLIFGAEQTIGALSNVWLPSNPTFFYRDTARNLFLEDRLQPRQFSFSSDDIGNLYLGIEDLVAIAPSISYCTTCSDYDYNDLVVSFRPTPVPEPSTLLLLGLGLLVVARTVRCPRSSVD